MHCMLMLCGTVKLPWVQFVVCAARQEDNETVSAQLYKFVSFAGWADCYRPHSVCFDIFHLKFCVYSEHFIFHKYRSPMILLSVTHLRWSPAQRWPTMLFVLTVHNIVFCSSQETRPDIDCCDDPTRNIWSIRITNVWNSLCPCIVTAPSVNSFKNRLDNQWAS